MHPKYQGRAVQEKNKGLWSEAKLGLIPGSATYLPQTYYLLIPNLGFLAHKMERWVMKRIEVYSGVLTGAGLGLKLY